MMPEGLLEPLTEQEKITARQMFTSGTPCLKCHITGDPTHDATAIPLVAGFDWERVNLGFVSAYILVRGGEATVVDTGVARISRYSARTKVQRLPIEAISQASANQRSGRCGRVEAGVAIRLMYEAFDDVDVTAAFVTEFGPLTRIVVQTTAGWTTGTMAVTFNVTRGPTSLPSSTATEAGR